MTVQTPSIEALKTTLNDIKSKPLDDSSVQDFARELDQLKAEITAQVGDKDIDYIESVYQVSRICEIAGRLLIHFSSNPVSWSLGVLSLWVHLQLDNLEIHHPVQHGAYDRLPEATHFHSENYYHNSPVDEESWRYRHNVLHHSYTGQVERDPDVTFGFFRLGEEIDKRYYHTIQPAMLIMNSFVTAQSMAILSSGLGDFIYRIIPGYHPEDNPGIHKELTLKEFQKSLWRYLRKAVPNAAYNFGLYGLLAGPLLFGKVTLGTMTAMVLRNLFTGLSFYTGHMVEGVKHYSKPPRNRAEWYVQQIEGTANVQAPPLVSMLMGHLNYQIEHHLFPKLPPNRLEEIAPRVEALCQKYGINYITGSFPEQVTSVFRRLGKYTR
jgi:NADPH-dependent stearoyl-CoA 9-desaturase